jgi:hypothetical protein
VWFERLAKTNDNMQNGLLVQWHCLHKIKTYF